MKFGYIIEDKIKKRKKMKERKGRRRRRKKGSTLELLAGKRQVFGSNDDEIKTTTTMKTSIGNEKRCSEDTTSISMNSSSGRGSGSKGLSRRGSLSKGSLSSFVLIGVAIALITDFADKPRGVRVAAAAAATATGTGGSEELGEGLTLHGSRSASSAHQNPLASTPSPQQMEKIKRDSKVSALVGQNVILNCAVQFKDGVEEPFVVNWLKYPNQLPIYIWYAGYPAHVAQGYENRVSRIGQASLNLSQVRDSDQGLYLCKINYLDKGPEDKSTEIWNWMFLDVQAPPRFSQTPAPINYVQAGDSLHLTCQAESTPAPILRWYKNKVPIDSDQGPYRLSASAGPGERPSGSSAVAAADSGAGSHANATSSSSKQLFGAHQTSQLDLFIDNVQAGTTTGDYKCLASNSEGSIEARSQVVLALPAVITSMPAEQTALEGDKVELVCQATALPSNITYKWLFNDKPIQTLKWFESRYSIKRDGTLIIYSIHRDDHGQYKCQATNGLSHRAPPASPSASSPKRQQQVASSKQQRQQVDGTGSESAAASGTTAPIYAEKSTQLHVEYMARITHSPAVQYLPLGLPGLIRCFFQASPPAKYYAWNFNDQQFDPDKDPNVERLNNGSLLIRQVTKQYEGRYMCAAFNKHGSAGTSAPMEVRVEEPPRFEARPADFYKATVNGHVKIPCEASGSPKPTVSWRRVLGQATAQRGGSGPLSQASTTTASNPMLLAPNDEAANEPDEQHFYSSEPATQHERAAAGSSALDEAPPNEAANRNSDDYEEAQQSVIQYAKLPSDRSEYKNSYLLLHALRKDDLGRYECVIENEIATLVASTMLYIEETTPHAPTNIQVETKAWSAHLSWTPGYDGGFEQSFVIWFRQVERPTTAAGQNDDQQANVRLPGLLNPMANHVKEHHEPVDLNWRSVDVQPSDAKSFTVQNLSQDTSYEFYVRAKNIIGDGPGSQTVLATTKRAISGSLAPVNVMEPIASISPMATDPTRHTPIGSGPSADDDEEAGSTFNPSVISIIHLVDYTTPSTNQATNSNGASDGSDSQSSVSQINSVQNQMPNNNNQSREDQSSGSNSTKVIRIYFPSKQQQTSLNSNSSDQLQNSITNKRPRFDQPDQSSSSSSALNASHSSEKSQELTQEDMSTAPQNISMTKVAQGWVINWWPPQRLVPEKAPKGSQIPVLSQVTGSDSVTVPQQHKQQLPSAYSVEYREKSTPNWIPLATSRERSLLLKDLKPGSEYLFRVFAMAASGAKGAPSAEFRYLIPDNRRRPGSSQALSAGVVSGVLFFIACIVIAVCAVNMCNKRRKKRAGKAAYVMMACPVLESHHDIAALNSNSLMKNANPTEGRVPSVNGTGGGSHLADNIRAAFGSSVGADRPLPPAQGPTSPPKGRFITEALANISRLLSADRDGPTGGSSGPTGQDPNGHPTGAGSRSNERIKFTSNAPLPVDVSPTDQMDGGSSLRVVDGGARGEIDGQAIYEQGRAPPAGPSQQTQQQQQQEISQTPIDDYWVRKPSDRKWGTLTLAASRLAERRARQAARLQHQNRTTQDHQQPQQSAGVGASIGDEQEAAEVDSLAEEYYEANVRSSRTLPRSFGASPAVIGHHRAACYNLQSQDRTRHEQFNSWLQNQIRGQNPEEQMIRQQRPPPTSANTMPMAAPLVQPRPSRAVQAIRQHPFDGNHHHHGQQLLLQPHRQLQPQYHQRSRSHVEPRLLASYWPAMQAMAAPQSAVDSQQPAPVWTGAVGQPMAYEHLQQHGHFGGPMVGVGGNNSADFYLRHQPPVYLDSCKMLDRTTYWMLDTSDPTDQSLACTTTQPMGKRNSLQRSTLPMAAPLHPAPLLPSMMMMMGREKLAPQQQAGAFYPRTVVGGSGAVNDDNGAPPPLPPPPQQRCSRPDDDPVTANACLGSYKRKRRLPHIEAQFTITPPELPPKEQSQPAAKEDHLTAAKRERDALQSGHLFVRSIQHQDQHQLQAEPRGAQAGSSERQPRGMPQPGQRSEQRRLRPQSPLAQVETMGAREKIETYLRHYDRVKEHERLMLAKSHSSSQGDILSPEDIGPQAISCSPIQVDQVNELTFQPYHNLPSLKYTISLPLCRARDGTLLLNETGHLRRSRRCRDSSESGARQPETSGRYPATASAGNNKSRSNPLALGEDGCAKSPKRPKRKPLGSSSSCPAPPAEFCNTSSEQVFAPSSSAHKPLACSLESAIDQPTLSHGITMANTCEPDSLECSLDTIVAHRRSQARHSLYLRAQANMSSLSSPADYSSIRETLMLDVPSPPPPIPPHRTQNAEAQTSPPLGEVALKQASVSEPEGRCESPEPDFALRDAPGSGGLNSLRDMQTRESIVSTESPNGSSDANNSASSTSSSSSQTSSTGTTTENGGDMSEPLTNDHSVDENYEFDQVSSCSSSTRHRKCPPNGSAANGLPGQANQSARTERIQINGAIYSQVNKRQPEVRRKKKKEKAANGNNNSTTRDGSQGSEEATQVVRSQIYDNSRCKEQPLADGSLETNNHELANYYDTVHDENTQHATKFR